MELFQIWNGHYFVEVLTETDYSNSEKPHCESESKNSTTFRETVASPNLSNNADMSQIINEIERIDLSMSFEKIVWRDDHWSETDSMDSTFIAEKYMTRYVYF